MSFALQVVEFNQQVLGIQPRIQAPLSDAELKLSLHCLREEIQEFEDACNLGDYIGQIDAMIDLQYFAMGVLYKLGLTASQIEKCCTAVHEANMEKKLGVKAGRGDGSAADAVKPEGWEPPEHRIGAILES